MQGGDNDEQLFYNVDVYVVAPTQELAQYIVATMYPDYESICKLMMILLELPNDFIHQPPEGYAYQVKPFKKCGCYLVTASPQSFQFYF